MRIGVIGYYGHKNAGDERILYCLRRYFEEHELVVMGGYADAWNRREELNQCDFVLIGGGGLILRGHGRHARLIEYLNPPLGCVGISVEASHADNQALIDVLKTKAEFIYVRDERSRFLMGNHPKVMVGPDLTFLYPYEEVVSAQEDTCGLNLRSWHYWNAEYRGWFHHLVAMLDHHYPQLETIYPLSKWSPEKVTRILWRYFDNLVPIPLYTEEGNESDANVLRKILRMSPDHYSDQEYKRCRYFVGMRLHSLIFACQMGLPFISLSYQPKNEEFCRVTGMERFSQPLYDLGQLPSRILDLKEKYLMWRQNLLQYTADQRRDAEFLMRKIAGLMGL